MLKFKNCKFDAPYNLVPRVSARSSAPTRTGKGKNISSQFVERVICPSNFIGNSNMQRVFVVLLNSETKKFLVKIVVVVIDMQSALQ